MVTQITVTKASPQLITPQPYFAQRLINFTFTLAPGNGTFVGVLPEGSNQITVGGVRASVKILNAGGRSMGTMQAAIYGLQPNVYNQISTLGMVPTATRKNSIMVHAGDSVRGMTLVFQGTITNAFADFSAMPECALQVIAQVGAAAAVESTPPISVNGSASVATVMSQIAAQMGLEFENNGVNVQIASPYWPRTLREQALAIVQAAGIQWNGGFNGVLAIWPTGGSRKTNAVIAISPAGGMVGYPGFTSNGLILKNLFFLPVLDIGRQILVTSSLPQACGTWAIYKIAYDLETLVRRGKWFMTMEASVPGLVPVAP